MIIDLIAVRQFYFLAIKFMGVVESLAIDTPVDHNPTVFTNPDEFRPSRWYGVSDHDTSMYGIGPRACIGRKFAQTEALCFLSLLLRDWKLDVVLGQGETRRMYERRVMGNAGIFGMSFGVGAVPMIKLIRRT